MSYSPEFIQKLLNELQKLNKPHIDLKFKLQDLSRQFKSERARAFLNEGVMRRVETLMHCANSIYTVYPPGRSELLTKKETYDVTVYIQTFLINIYGALDNIAWTLALEGGFPDPDKNKLKISLANDGMSKYIPVTLFNYLKADTFKSWFAKYAKEYRDWTAHRIPPYLPPFTIYEDKAEEYNRLESEAHEALFKFYDVDKHRRLITQSDLLRENCEFIATHKGMPPFRLHAQLICDLMTIQEVLNHLFIGLIETYEFKPTDNTVFIKNLSENLNYFDM